MGDPKVTTGRLSELMGLKRRASWSWLHKHLDQLEPGESVRLEIPEGLRLQDVRSHSLNYFNRQNKKPGWRLSTIAEPGVLYFYLSPVDVVE